MKIENKELKTYFYPGNTKYYLGKVLDVAILLNKFVVIKNPTEEQLKNAEYDENKFFELHRKL